jgi:Type IV secretory pathway, VirB3-like protein
MTGPFPDLVRVPTGLTRPRTKMGLPAWAWALLFILALAPPVLIGRWGFLGTGLALGIGAWIAHEAAWDVKFLETWLSELPLKQRYH